MGMNLSGGFSAGAGADMLQQIILHAAQQQAEQQRIAIAQEEARSRDADRAAQRDYQNRSLQSLDDDRKERQAAADEERARRAAADAVVAEGRQRDDARAEAEQTLPGSILSGDIGARFKKYNPTTVEPYGLDPKGAANPQDTASGAPPVLQLTPTGQLRFKGTAAQQEKQAALDGKNAPKHSPIYTEWQDAVANGYKGSFTKYQDEDANRKRVTPQTVLVQTVDENGNPVTKIVPKTAGESYAKPLSATTDARVRSAETVNAIGTDLIAKLSDPKYAATVGPLLGRFGKLRDLIGNPPPELAELAGQIESYALANMGVHGMRSAQGAQAIAKLLDARHTPESLIATIRGLNDFSARFAGANRPKAPASGTATPKTAPKDPLGIR